MPTSHDDAASATPAAAESLFARPVLVAVDDTDAGDAPLAVAAALARARGAYPALLNVIPMQLYPAPAIDVEKPLIFDRGAIEERRERRLVELTDRLAAAAGSDTRWSIQVLVGAPGDLIVEEARRNTTRLIIIGLRHHHRLERAIGRETALHVIRHARASVLAVTPELRSLPHRAVAGLDFSRASVHAARNVAQLLADDATLSLAHVEPNLNFAATEASEGIDVVQSEGVAGAFVRVQRELHLPRSVRVETIVLKGDASRELLALADRCGADLLAVGSHRHNLIDRMLLGSVTTELVRAARCSTLVAPPASSALEASARPSM